MKNKKKKPKVAIFHCGFIYSGGGERIVLEEARGLKKRGYEVLVYVPTLDEKKCYPEFLKEVGAKMFLPSFIGCLPLRDAIRMTVTSLLAPLLAVNFRDVDVFVGANQPGAWIAFCMARVLRKPYIVYLNQPNRIIYPRPVDVKYGWYTTVKDYQFLFKFLQLIRPMIAWFDRLSITSANRLLVNGSYIGDIIQNVYSARTIEAAAGSYHYPQDLLFLNPGSAFEGSLKIGGESIAKPYALITNRHDPQKRFDYVIRAMEHVLKEYPKANLVIPGPFTAHTEKLRKSVKGLGIEDKIYFLGEITESDLQKLYRNCAVYCYPSPQEDFGLGPLEAGGWGVPTVAWNHGGPTVTVEDGVTGFLAKPYKTKDYAEKMLKLFGNKELRAKMGQAAWERTKNKFSWDKHVDVLETSIKKVLT